MPMPMPRQSVSLGGTTEEKRTNLLPYLKTKISSTSNLGERRGLIHSASHSSHPAHHSALSCACVTEAFQDRRNWERTNRWILGSMNPKLAVASDDGRYATRCLKRCAGKVMMTVFSGLCGS